MITDRLAEKNGPVPPIKAKIHHLRLFVAKAFSR